MAPRLTLLVMSVLVTLFASESVLAAPVRVDFSGTVSSLEAFPNGGSNSLLESLASSIGPGTAFSGSFTFNNAQANTQDGFYSLFIPPWSLSTTLGSLPLVAQQSYDILLLTTPGDEPGHVNVFALQLAGGSLGGSFQIYLKDPFGHPLGSTDLDEVPWDESEYTQREATWILQSASFPGDMVRVMGTIDSLSGPPPVPEPGATVMLAAAALALLGAAIRSQASLH